MKYKLIACDLDGTLLDSKGCLSEENFKAISELTRRGIIFVPTTGRSFNEAPEAVRIHPDIRYFISSDGSVIQDLQTGERKEFLIDGKTATEVYKIMKECNILQANHKKDYSLVEASRLGDDIMAEYAVSDYFCNQLRNDTKPIDNLDDEFLNNEPCEMLSGCIRNSSDAKRLMDAIKDIKGLHSTSAMSGVVEIVSSEAGKQNAVKYLIDKLGITIDELITVGDSRNDFEMTKFAKHSIAMSNAVDLLKAEASHIGCSNNEHIAKYILENII